jgi:predicted permease
MSEWRRELRARLTGLNVAPEREAEIVEELAQHLDEHVQDLIASGASEDEACAAALAGLDVPGELARRLSAASLRDATRSRAHFHDASRSGWLASILQDVRQAARSVWASPRISAAAVLTLAIGIGATTAIFTLVQQVVLQSLPVPRPEQLWRVGDTVRCCHATGYAQRDWSLFSWEAYTRFRADTHDFEDLAAFQIGNAELSVRDREGPIAARNGEYVSGNFFRTFGISAWRGRLLTDADDSQGAPLVAVMSFHTWQRQYASASSVVGATFDINGRPFTVIGVTPPDFVGAKIAASAMPDFWLPLTTEPLMNGATSRLENPGAAWLDLIGRVRPGTNPDALQAQLRVELREWLATHVADMTPDERAARDDQTLFVTPGSAGVPLMRKDYEDALRLLLFAATCVLLLAGANFANLMLVRGLRDRPRTALRAALGAEPSRLIRQALVECIILGVAGAMAGVVVAYAATKLTLHLAFLGRSTWVPVTASPSLPVLLFALVVALATGILFGLVPAWTTSRADPIEVLRGASRTTAGHRQRSHDVLVVAQAALALVVVSAAAMLGLSRYHLMHQRFGFDPTDRYLISINTMLSHYEPAQLGGVVRDLENRLRAVPGVRMASAALYAPMNGLDWSHDVTIDRASSVTLGTDVRSHWTRATPGFFATLGDPIVRGRSITDADNANGRRVAVVNETFAKRFFAGENPIGRRFGPAPGANANTYEIVGVAADMRYFPSDVDAVSPMYFVPEAQGARFDDATLESREVWSHYPYAIVIWAPGHPPDVAARVTGVLADFDVPMYSIRSYADVISASFGRERFVAGLTGLFAVVGLVLAGLGLYGVTAYRVGQRTGEIGVRMALGASRTSVVRLVLGGASRQVGIGLGLGIPAAIAVGHVISSQLVGVRPWDAAVLTAATLVLLLAAVTAAAVPAYRASRVDPLQALKTE